MWNKIGSFLNYPEDWCSFVFRGLLAVTTLLMLVFILVSPLIIYLSAGFTIYHYCG
jgi:nucleoside permease NupC